MKSSWELSIKPSVALETYLEESKTYLSQALFRCLNYAQRLDNCVVSSSRKLGGAAKYLIDSSEKCICRLRFEFWSPHVIERRSYIQNAIGEHDS